VVLQNCDQTACPFSPAPRGKSVQGHRRQINRLAWRNTFSISSGSSFELTLLSVAAAAHHGIKSIGAFHDQPRTVPLITASFLKHPRQKDNLGSACRRREKQLLFHRFDLNDGEEDFLSSCVSVVASSIFIVSIFIGPLRATPRRKVMAWRTASVPVPPPNAVPLDPHIYISNLRHGPHTFFSAPAPLRHPRHREG
jgi:hypothetical protein